MKKKVFRERYEKNIVNVETYKEHIQHPQAIQIEKQSTRRKKNVKSNK